MLDEQDARTRLHDLVETFEQDRDVRRVEPCRRFVEHVERAVGPFDEGTVLITPSAQLAPVDDDGGDWAVVDHDEEILRVPLTSFRVSVLWKADVYTSAEEKAARQAHPLSMGDVAEVFAADLEERDLDLRLDLDRVDDPDLRAAFSEAYPEAVPVGALRSVFAR